MSGLKIALVTGAASNIGKATAEDLGRDHRVILADIADTSALAAQIGKWRHLRERDVSRADDCQRWIETAKQAGGLHALVHAAGITRETVPAGKVKLSDWEDIIRINLTGSFILMQAAMELLAATADSSAVLLSSRAGQVGASAHGVNPQATKPHYVSSKAGVIALTKAFAMELAPRGVRVNCVAPGPIEGPMIPREKWGAIAKMVPLAASADRPKSRPPSDSCRAMRPVSSPVIR